MAWNEANVKNFFDKIHPYIIMSYQYTSDKYYGCAIHTAKRSAQNVTWQN